MTGVYPRVELPTLPNVPDTGQHTVEVSQTQSSLNRPEVVGLLDLRLDPILDIQGHAEVLSYKKMVVKEMRINWNIDHIGNLSAHI